MRFLEDSSDESIRAALAEVAPWLAGEVIEHVERVPDVEPDWFRGTARVGEDHFVKYAWSERPAARIVFEGRLLSDLHAADLPVPRLVHEPTDLACFVTEYVAGSPFDPWSVPTGERLQRWTVELAGFLVALHGLDTDMPASPEAPEHWVQATSDQLRDDEFLRIVHPSQQRLVHRWCDWCDEVLEEEVPRVLVQGDLHGFNMRWDPQQVRLLLVADFEMAGLADPALDFRYQMTNATSNDLVLGVLDGYRALGGVVSTERIAAWTILSVLGDARWRTLAGVPLPGGGTAREWIDDLADRLPGLGAPGR